MDQQKQTEADLLLRQGFRQAKAGQFKEAAQFYQQALAIYRETGDRFREVTSLNHEGYWFC